MAQFAFVEDDLRVGRLVEPLTLRVETGQSYYLVYPEVRRSIAKIAAFEDWITGTV